MLEAPANTLIATVLAVTRIGATPVRLRPATNPSTRWCASYATLYVIRAPERDLVLAALNAVGIGAGIHYPIPIHLQGAYAELGAGPGSFPVTERAAEEILSLPMFPGITTEQQETVATALRDALA